jgi:hypothetical protein
MCSLKRLTEMLVCRGQCAPRHNVAPISTTPSSSQQRLESNLACSKTPYQVCSQGYEAEVWC